jgi:hypothetical protein
VIALWVLGPPLLAGGAGAALGGPLWGASIGVFGAVAAAAWLRSQDRLALRAAGAEVLEPPRHPRVHNLAAGLSRDLGTPPPELRLLPSPRLNALVCRPGPTPVLALSAGLLAACTRTELEAVVASLLLRVAGDGVERARLAAAFGLRPAPDPGLDIRAAAVTRYPPALAAALLKCDPQPGRYRAFYFLAEGSSPELRAAELLDL